MCRVSFKPQGETKGLKGTVPRTGLPRGQTHFRAVLSERATGCVADPSTVSSPRGSAAHLLTEHECAKGVPTQESAMAHGADGASTPRRATNPRTGGRPTQAPAGTNPRTGQAAVVLFNFERIFCVCIALEGDLSEVAYAVGGTSLAGLDFLRYRLYERRVLWASRCR